MHMLEMLGKWSGLHIKRISIVTQQCMTAGKTATIIEETLLFTFQGSRSFIFNGDSYKRKIDRKSSNH